MTEIQLQIWQCDWKQVYEYEAQFIYTYIYIWYQVYIRISYYLMSSISILSIYHDFIQSILQIIL